MNRIDKNVKKGTVGGLITLAATACAMVIVKKLSLPEDQTPVITGVVSAIFLGICDAIKHIR